MLMAWNQPGGNGGRDPWGGRGGQQGPPDLDEVVKKLQATLSRLFGGGKLGGVGGKGGGRVGGAGAKGIGLIALVVLIIWAVLGAYIVDPPERAVVLRFGEFLKITDPGLNWAPYLIDSVEKVNVQQINSENIGFRRTPGGTTSVPHESLMLTEDENIVDLDFTVQYRISNPADYLFNVEDPRNTLRQATESAVREIVGKNEMDFVLTEGRDAVATEVHTLAQSILDEYKTGLYVTSVNMQSAQPPREVQDAFFDAVKAREDEERKKNEARAFAADILPKARGEANAIRERALAYEQRVVANAEGEADRFLKVLREYNKAPEVTRKRLYLESVESVLGNSTKVLLGVEDGNNLLYLPLDKLVEMRKSATSAGATESMTTESPAAGSTGGDTRRQRFSDRVRSR
jgi:membrane protease subunit HflK